MTEVSVLEGMVVALQANYLEVEVTLKDGHKFIDNVKSSIKIIRLLCTLRNRILYKGSSVCVGDLVLIEEINWRNSRAVITDVYPRRNHLLRPPVANVDHVYVILSLASPSFNIEQASRFLLNAEQSHLQVSIVLSKRDLVSVNQFNQQFLRLKSWGYKMFAISTKNGEGVDELRHNLQSAKLSVFCGPSGVGKSSLINHLLSKTILRVGALSGKLKRGRHTTRHVELFAISEGSFVADTPGFNRPDVQFDPKTLSFLFPEIRNQKAQNSCKFRDCLHLDEPGCIINKKWERYSQYREFLKEII